MSFGERLLELDRVSVVRDDTRILDQISATITRGRHCAVLGPNGAGKTSLLNLLLRHFYPSIDDAGHQGTVRILGQTVWEVSELRKRMGILSTKLDHSFSHGRTGRMNALEAVASGFTATQLVEFGPPMTKPMRAIAARSLDRVGMADLASRSMQTLSTGERRRVLIARALVHSPDILVLDEPTTGLDIAARHHFLEMLAEILNQQSVTLVLVTHHLEEILPGIEHVILLDGGRITFDGCRGEAMERNRLAALFKIPKTLLNV